MDGPLSHGAPSRGPAGPDLARIGFWLPRWMVWLDGSQTPHQEGWGLASLAVRSLTLTEAGQSVSLGRFYRAGSILQREHDIGELSEFGDI